MLEIRDVEKSFDAVQALRGVSFSVAPGEAHAIVGENGAGKSTLLKILAGCLTADRGEILLDGKTLSLSCPHDALSRGIGVVHQEMLAFPSLSVSANVFAGREPVGWAGRLKEREMHERTRELLARLRLPVSPDALAGSLSAAQRQLLQVARALAFDCRVLALDEPTASLTQLETDRLFEILWFLRGRGVTLIYVSHRLPEVFRLADRVTVLRDGRLVNTFPRRQATHDAIVRAMVGRDLPERGEDLPSPSEKEPLLSLEGLTRRPYFEDVSLSLGEGEIVGLFGLVGSGRSEILETIFALHKPEQGSVHLEGRAVRFGSSRDAVRAGIALVPEERGRQGLFFNLGLRENLLLPRETKRGAVLVRGGEERRTSRKILSDWRIKAVRVDLTPDVLSGGNQQKLVLAKWLTTRPRVLLLDEPTRGVDVGAKYEIHEIIRRQAAEGSACLVASSDLPEILTLAHRIVVVREGRIQGELRADEADEESVMQLATAPPRDAA